MLLVELDAIEIDRCLNCAGAWLDRGELELIAERAHADPEKLRHRLASLLPGSRSERRCPRCRKRLRCTHLGGPGSVEIDECPRGHGFWFDHGELENLVSSDRDPSLRPIAAFLGAIFEHDLEPSNKGD